MITQAPPHAFLCTGGLGDMYVRLLKIKESGCPTCDVYYVDELHTHESAIRDLFLSQPEINKVAKGHDFAKNAIEFDHNGGYSESGWVRVDDDYVETCKKEIQKVYGEKGVSVLDSSISNISTIKKVDLPPWENLYGGEYIAINTGAGNFQIHPENEHNINRRWDFNVLYKLINFIATNTKYIVVLTGQRNFETEKFCSLSGSRIFNEMDASFVEQINVMVNAKLNIAFEGVNLMVPISFNKLTVVKNNPPLFDFHEKKIRYLDETAYKNLIILDNYTLEAFLPILKKLKADTL